MQKTKQFDCVQMKWDIQQRILKEIEGLAPEEARAARRRKIENDPVVGPFLRRLEANSNA